jgi:hypothetical protein
VSQKDPTDDVLAAIASIFDKSDAPAATDQSGGSRDESDRPRKPSQPVDGYSRLGPGPLDAIRFKWTARRDDNGDFFVDETIGDQSRAISTGPMDEDEVIPFIDARVQDARERFDKLKSEMTVRNVEQTEARKAVEQAHVEHDAREDQGF